MSLTSYRAAPPRGCATGVICAGCCMSHPGFVVLPSLLPRPLLPRRGWRVRFDRRPFVRLTCFAVRTFRVGLGFWRLCIVLCGLVSGLCWDDLAATYSPTP
jgi:hypothetical protein